MTTRGAGFVSEHRPLLLAVGLVVAQYLVFGGGKSLAWDEFNSVEVLLRGVPLPPDQAPLYYWLMRPWAALFGGSEFALRLPSLLFGCLALVRLWDLVRMYRVRWLWAFPVLAVEPRLLVHVLNVRGYTLYLWLSLEVIIALVRYLRNEQPSPWTSTLAMAAVVMTHVFGLIFCGIAMATVTLTELRRDGLRSRWHLAGCGLLGLAVWRILLLARAAEHTGAMRREATSFDWDVYVAGLGDYLIGYPPQWSIWLLPLVGLAWCWFALRQGREGLVLTLLAVPAMGLLWYGWAHELHRLTFRYVIFIMPLAVLSIWWSLSRLRPKWLAVLPAVVYVGFWFSTNIRFTWNMHQANWRGAVALMESSADDEDYLLLYPRFMQTALWYYAEDFERVALVHQDGFAEVARAAKATVADPAIPCQTTWLLQTPYRYELLWGLQQAGLVVTGLWEFGILDVIRLECPPQEMPWLPVRAPAADAQMDEFPVMEWAVVARAEKYVLFFYGPGNIVHRREIQEPSFDIPTALHILEDDLRSGTYHYQVFAVDEHHGVLSWSGPQRFELIRGTER